MEASTFTGERKRADKEQIPTKCLLCQSDPREIHRLLGSKAGIWEASWQLQPYFPQESTTKYACLGWIRTIQGPISCQSDVQDAEKSRNSAYLGVALNDRGFRILHISPGKSANNHQIHLYLKSYPVRREVSLEGTTNISSYTITREGELDYQKGEGK